MGFGAHQAGRRNNSRGIFNQAELITRRVSSGFHVIESLGTMDLLIFLSNHR